MLFPCSTCREFTPRLSTVGSNQRNQGSNAMGRFTDLVGQTFGRWTILSYAGRERWNCRCSCGGIKEVDGKSLRAGRSTGCGRGNCADRGSRLRHGEKRRGNYTRLYTIWSTMKARCSNPNKDGYEYYGGRGIRVCEEWINSYEEFRDWALNNGYKPHLTIDRFPDSDGDYKPDNCRWATKTEQSRNRRRRKSATSDDSRSQH